MKIPLPGRQRRAGPRGRKEAPGEGEEALGRGAALPHSGPGTEAHQGPRADPHAAGAKSYRDRYHCLEPQLPSETWERELTNKNTQLVKI